MNSKQLSTVAEVGGFPLGKTGGLIEAHRPLRRATAEKCWFPLGKTGGLIEAPLPAPRAPAGYCVSAG